MFATPGRDSGAYAGFAEDLVAHGGRAEQVREVCQDMSEALPRRRAQAPPRCKICSIATTSKRSSARLSTRSAKPSEAITQTCCVTAATCGCATQDLTDGQDSYRLAQATAGKGVTPLI